MKKNYFFIILLFLSALYSFGQNTGDFRSYTSGAWNSFGSWETWDGISWGPTLSYPGENTGTYNVTILTVHSITIASDFSTFSMGTVIVNGTLILGDGTSNQHNTTLSTTLLTIGSTGILTFSGPKVKLTLPDSNAVLIIQPSGIINGSCTNNDEIFIGTKKYANCVGSGPNIYSFGDILNAGGTFNAVINTPSSDPYVAEACSLVSLEGGYNGTVSGTINYKWFLRDPDNNVTTLSTSTAANFTPTILGEYLVSFEVTSVSDSSTNLQTLTINVGDTTKPIITLTGENPQVLQACSSYVELGATASDGCLALGAVAINSTAVNMNAVGSYIVTYNITDAKTNVATQVTRTVDVTDNNTIILSSAVGTDAQTKCISTPIIDITYATTEATGVTFSGLPAGITGSWAANVATITGTPTASGTFNYTVTLTGGCGTITATGSITVTPNNTIVLSSAVGTDAQTKCISTPIIDITYTTTEATGATFSGLPTGVTGNWAGNVVTISGTPTVSGAFNYTVTTTGGCTTPAVTAAGTITVTPNNTIALSSGAGTNNQTKCINVALSNITFATTGATGATFSGLPTGVTGNWAGNVITISGTPTVSGTFNYTVTTTGGCTTPAVAATGTITVTPNNTITLTSVVGTDAQTLCINTAITNITYSTTGATGATFIGLPTGVTGSRSGNKITISGSPSVSAASSYNYTVTLTGGCATITATGSILVNPTPVGSASPQTICSAGTSNVALNSAVSGTTFTWTAAILTSPTGGTITGQGGCAAACGTSIAQKLTNSGTTAGVIRYTITPIANSCPGPTFTVDVTVNPKPVVTLANIMGQCSVTVPVPTATDNCGATVTGTTGDPLFFNTEGPHTVNWSFDFGNGIVIVKTQNITIDDTVAPVANISILPELTFPGCEVKSITAPTATDTCKGKISGITTTPFPITKQGTTIVTWTYNDGNGNTTTQTQNVILTAPPISGGSLTGYISNIPTTPTDNIAITSCPDDSNPITMNLSGEEGTIVRWEKFEAGGTSWAAINGTSNLHSYNTTFNFTNTKSTLFRVLIQEGDCTEYSNMVNVHAIPPDVPPTLDQNYFNICLNDQVTLVARSGYASALNVGNGGDYNTGQFPDKWDPTQWRIDGQVAGTAWTAAANNTNFNNWSGTNNHPVGTKYRIEYDSNDFKFGIAHGNYNSADYIAAFPPGNPTTLETPIFSLVGLSKAEVKFDQAYNLYAADICKLELSLDGGATYTVVLQNLVGPDDVHALSWGDSHGSPVTYPYEAPQSNNSTTTYFDFQNDDSSFDISAYIGNDNVRVKWTFFGTTDESVWAIDNISIPVRPYSDELEWTDGLGEPGEYIIRGELEVAYTFAPTSPGVHQYGATSLINGCRAYDPDGTAIATVVVNYAYAGEAQGYTNAECGERTVKLNAYDNTKTADQNAAAGAYRLATNTFSDDPGSGATGTWSVFNTTNTCGTYSFSDVSSPTSSFSGDAGVYTLRWTLDTSGCYSDVQVTLTNCKVVDFDGTDDYIAFKNNYGLGSAFSIEVWVKPDPQPESPSSNIQTILSKRNANSLINGYDLRLVGSTLSFNWNNGSKITSPFPLSTSRWYHVAVTYAGGTYKLYVDGIEVVSSAGSTPITNTFECIAGAMDQANNSPNRPVNYFSGWLDELRIWGVGLSPDHIRQMMNQQINSNATAVRGEIIPIDINGPDVNKDDIDDQPIYWSDLIGYYRMDQIDCGYLKPFGGKGVDGKLRNITSSQEQTAPLPYVSIRDGNWTDRGTGTTPWEYGASVWDYPNSTGYNGTLIDWNIVQMGHNISSGNKDITLLGLISTAGKLTVADPSGALDENNNGQGLWISHYLKLDGVIDLVGESQLVEKRYTAVQFSESILDATSLGYIERDQQGKQNSFNYNYWSSPVSNIQGAINNTSHSIGSVLRDGTISAAPQIINFGNGAFFADGALENPIKISNRWIWSYNSSTPDSNTDWQDYFQWNFIQSFGSLKAGEGFTMKGTGGTAAIDDLQNHVFIGKPNSGTITLTLPPIQTYLIGNPYPSALDANEFILDNLAGRAGVNMFNGALYFWDHFGLSNNHDLALYEGGYATYTLAGGVPGINDSPLTLNDSASGSKIPEHYIPVGQGFFVDAVIDDGLIGGVTPTCTTGCNIIFKNSQRVFVRESPGNSLFMKTSSPTKSKTTDIDTRLKIRLGYNSPAGAHRQILVTADPITTNQFDIGYDAPMFDTNDNDMFWVIGNTQFVIQGVPDFNGDRIIPLGIIIANEGLSTIKIDALENVTSNTKIYLYDSLTGIYHNIKDNPITIALAIGEYDKRFSLRFTDKTLSMEDFNLSESILVYFSNNTKILNIENKFIGETVNKVFLFNLLGQSITNWDVKERKQSNIQIPIKNIPSGVYVVRLKTTKGDFSKKIIIP